MACSAGGSGGGTVAKDALGNDLKAAAYIASKKPVDYTLAQGLKVIPLSKHEDSVPTTNNARSTVSLQLHHNSDARAHAQPSIATWFHNFAVDLSLQGDPTYLIVNDKSELEDFGLNAICTHLGCVVPWVAVNHPGLDISARHLTHPCWPHGKQGMCLLCYWASPAAV